jgi:hypothetical protein
MNNKYILILIILLFFTGCSTLNKAKIVLPPSWINMKEIAPDVYVNIDMNTTQQQKLLIQISQAKQFVKDIWGEVISKPIIYACSTNECTKSLGIGASAHQVLNHIVLSPKALKKELISHEWSHAELYKRVEGFWNWKKIPTWFDEGVAVLVSHEIRHDERAWEKIINRNIKHPSTHELITMKQWHQATKKYNKDIDGNEIVVSYATAGHIVKKWYDKVGSNGLIYLINEVKNSASFDKIYNKTLERNSLP